MNLMRKHANQVRREQAVERHRESRRATNVQETNAHRTQAATNLRTYKQQEDAHYSSWAQQNRGQYSSNEAWNEAWQAAWNAHGANAVAAVSPSLNSYIQSVQSELRRAAENPGGDIQTAINIRRDELAGRVADGSWEDQILDGYVNDAAEQVLAETPEVRDAALTVADGQQVLDERLRTAFNTYAARDDRLRVNGLRGFTQEGVRNELRESWSQDVDEAQARVAESEALVAEAVEEEFLLRLAQGGAPLASTIPAADWEARPVLAGYSDEQINSARDAVFNAHPELAEGLSSGNPNAPALRFALRVEVLRGERNLADRIDAGTKLTAELPEGTRRLIEDSPLEATVGFELGMTAEQLNPEAEGAGEVEVEVAEILAEEAPSLFVQMRFLDVSTDIPIGGMTDAEIINAAQENLGRYLGEPRNEGERRRIEALFITLQSADQLRIQDIRHDVDRILAGETPDEGVRQRLDDEDGGGESTAIEAALDLVDRHMSAAVTPQAQAQIWDEVDAPLRGYINVQADYLQDHYQYRFHEVGVWVDQTSRHGPPAAASLVIDALMDRFDAGEGVAGIDHGFLPGLQTAVDYAPHRAGDVARWLLEARQSHPGEGNLEPSNLVWPTDGSGRQLGAAVLAQSRDENLEGYDWDTLRDIYEAAKGEAEADLVRQQNAERYEFFMEHREASLQETFDDLVARTGDLHTRTHDFGELSDTQERNLVGQALGLDPDNPEAVGEDGRAAGTDASAYTDPEKLAAIDQARNWIQETGGTDATVTFGAAVYASDRDGVLPFSLIRVVGDYNDDGAINREEEQRRRQDGTYETVSDEDVIIDGSMADPAARGENVPWRYADIDDYRRDNMLDDSGRLYMADSDDLLLHSNGRHVDNIDFEGVDAAVVTGWERARSYGDRAFGVVGLVGGVALIAGTGGLAAPAVWATTAWFSVRSLETAGEMSEHGQSFNPINRRASGAWFGYIDPTAGSFWLNSTASFSGFLSMGSGTLARGLGGARVLDQAAVAGQSVTNAGVLNRLRTFAQSRSPVGWVAQVSGGASDLSDLHSIMMASSNGQVDWGSLGVDSHVWDLGLGVASFGAGRYAHSQGAPVASAPYGSHEEGTAFPRGNEPPSVSAASAPFEPENGSGKRPRSTMSLRDEAGRLVDARVVGPRPSSLDDVYFPQGDEPTPLDYTHTYRRDPDSGEASIVAAVRGGSDDAVPTGGRRGRSEDRGLPMSMLDRVIDLVPFTADDHTVLSGLDLTYSLEYQDLRGAENTAGRSVEQMMADKWVQEIEATDRIAYVIYPAVGSRLSRQPLGVISLHKGALIDDSIREVLSPSFFAAEDMRSILKTNDPAQLSRSLLNGEVPTANPRHRLDPAGERTRAELARMDNVWQFTTYLDGERTGRRSPFASGVVNKAAKMKIMMLAAQVDTDIPAFYARVHAGGAIPVGSDGPQGNDVRAFTLNRRSIGSQNSQAGEGPIAFIYENQSPYPGQDHRFVTIFETPFERYIRTDDAGNTIFDGPGALNWFASIDTGIRSDHERRWSGPSVEPRNRLTIRLRDEAGQPVNAQVVGPLPSSLEDVYFPQGDELTPENYTHTFIRDQDTGEAYVVAAVRGGSDDAVPTGGRRGRSEDRGLPMSTLDRVVDLVPFTADDASVLPQLETELRFSPDYQNLGADGMTQKWVREIEVGNRMAYVIYPADGSNLPREPLGIIAVHKEPLVREEVNRSISPEMPISSELYTALERRGVLEDAMNTDPRGLSDALREGTEPRPKRPLKPAGEMTVQELADRGEVWQFSTYLSGDRTMPYASGVVNKTAKMKTMSFAVQAAVERGDPIPSFYARIHAGGAIPVGSDGAQIITVSDLEAPHFFENESRFHFKDPERDVRYVSHLISADDEFEVIDSFNGVRHVVWNGVERTISPADTARMLARNPEAIQLNSQSLGSQQSQSGRGPIALVLEEGSTFPGQDHRYVAIFETGPDHYFGTDDTGNIIFNGPGARAWFKAIEGALDADDDHHHWSAPGLPIGQAEGEITPGSTPNESSRQPPREVPDIRFGVTFRRRLNANGGVGFGSVPVGSPTLSSRSVSVSTRSNLPRLGKDALLSIKQRDSAPFRSAVESELSHAVRPDEWRQTTAAQWGLLPASNWTILPVFADKLIELGRTTFFGEGDPGWTMNIHSARLAGLPPSPRIPADSAYRAEAVEWSEPASSGHVIEIDFSPQIIADPRTLAEGERDFLGGGADDAPNGHVELRSDIPFDRVMQDIRVSPFPPAVKRLLQMWLNTRGVPAANIGDETVEFTPGYEQRFQVMLDDRMGRGDVVPSELTEQFNAAASGSKLRLQIAVRADDRVPALEEFIQNPTIEGVRDLVAHGHVDPDEAKIFVPDHGHNFHQTAIPGKPLTTTITDLTGRVYSVPHEETSNIWMIFNEGWPLPGGRRVSPERAASKLLYRAKQRGRASVPEQDQRRMPSPHHLPGSGNILDGFFGTDRARANPSWRRTVVLGLPHLRYGPVAYSTEFRAMYASNAGEVAPVVQDGTMRTYWVSRDISLDIPSWFPEAVDQVLTGPTAVIPAGGTQQMETFLTNLSALGPQHAETADRFRERFMSETSTVIGDRRFLRRNDAQAIVDLLPSLLSPHDTA
jgi:hypothetical protein